MATPKPGDPATEHLVTVHVHIGRNILVVDASFVLSHQCTIILPLQSCLLHLASKCLVMLPHALSQLFFSGILCLLFIDDFIPHIFSKLPVLDFLNPSLHKSLLHLMI